VYSVRACAQISAAAEWHSQHPWQLKEKLQPFPIHRMSLLSLPRARQLCRIGSLHAVGLPVTATVFGDTIKGTPCSTLRQKKIKFMTKYYYCDRVMTVELYETLHLFNDDGTLQHAPNKGHFIHTHHTLIVSVLRSIPVTVISRQPVAIHLHITPTALPLPSFIVNTNISQLTAQI